MKNVLLNSAVALVLCFAGLVILPARADSTTNAPAAAKPPMAVLDSDETAQLQKVRAHVLSTNPDLKAEEAKLKSMHDATQSQNPPPTPAQKDAMMTEWKDYQSKMRAEMLKLDPTLAPIFAKLDKAHHKAAAAKTSASS